MPGKPKLIPLSMVICDMVIEDKQSGKKSLIGLFNNINALKVPTVHSRLNVFVTLTEGIGPYEIMLKCVNMDDGKPIAQLKGPIQFNDPKQILEFNFELCGLPFVKFGNYRFDFYSNDELIISRKFTVSPTPTASQ